MNDTPRVFANSSGYRVGRKSSNFGTKATRQISYASGEIVRLVNDCNGDADIALYLDEV